MWYLVPIFFLGFMTPIQTAANSRLRQSVISPIVASFVSFSIGTIFLFFITIGEKGTIFIDRQVFIDLPWWAWLGGVCGLYGLTMNIIIFPKIGAVQTALMPMLGQISMGMVIDSFGLLRSTQYPFTGTRLLSLCFILAGVCMVILKKGKKETAGNKLTWQLLGISGGAIFAMQPSMNNLLSIGLYSSVHAAWICFITATIILFATVVINPSDRIHIPQIFSLNRPWWSWLGGIIGGIFVTGFAFFASKTGIGLLLVTSICGMLTCSLLIDKNGWLGATRKTVRPIQYCGLVLVIIGIIILRLT